MKLFFNKILMGLSLFFLINHASAHDILSLYKLALQNDNLLKAADMQAKAQDAETDEAKAAFLPHVGLDASYGRSDMNSSLAKPFPYIDNLPTDFSSTENYNSILLGITQNILDLSASHKIKASQFMVQAENIEVSIKTQEASFDFLKHYFNVLQNKEKLTLIDVQITDVEQDKKFALHQVAKGTGIVLPVYQTEMYLKELAAEKIASTNSLEGSLAELSLQSGVEVKDLDDIDVQKILQLLPPNTLDYWLIQVDKGNLNLKKAQLELQALAEEAASDKAKAYPTVYAQAGMIRERENLPIVQSVTNNEKMVAIGIKVPIFTGNYIDSDSRKLAYQLAADNYRYQDAFNNLNQSTKSIYADLLALHAKLYADLDAIKVAQAILKATRRSMDLKMKTFNDLLAAERTMISAQLTFQEDAYNALLIRAKLYQLSGQLNLEHMTELDSYLRYSKI